MLIVEKYGGSSVSTIEKIKNITLHLKEEVEKGNKLIVVLSAMGKTTNGLLDLVNQITPNPNKREVDHLLVTGEIVSISLASIALTDLGVNSISLNAFQLGITAEGLHENGLIKSIDKLKMLDYLKEYDVVFVAGFQGIDENGDFMTLGRGGSDTTAVAIAAVMQASCYIYTDVDGVYTVDPGIMNNAIRYNQISYDLMLEMASLGSGVLITRSVALASEYKVNLILLKSMNKEGTKIVKTDNIEKLKVAGLAINKKLIQIEIDADDIEDVLKALEDNGIKIDMFNINDHKMKFVISENDFKIFEKIFLTENFKYFKNVTKISIVGNGISSRGFILSKLLLSLNDIGINPRNISTSELAISFLVDNEDVTNVVRKLGETFELLNK